MELMQKPYILTWDDISDDCDMETKKMILSRIMKSIKVKRDYEIEIDLTVDCEQLGLAYPGTLEESCATVFS